MEHKSQTDYGASTTYRILLPVFTQPSHLAVPLRTIPNRKCRSSDKFNIFGTHSTLCMSPLIFLQHSHNGLDSYLGLLKIKLQEPALKFEYYSSIENPFKLFLHIIVFYLREKNFTLLIFNPLFYLCRYLLKPYLL